MEYKKCRQSAKRVISSAKEMKQKEYISDVNDPEHQNKATIKNINCTSLVNAVPLLWLHLTHDLSIQQHSAEGATYIWLGGHNVGHQPTF